MKKFTKLIAVLLCVSISVFPVSADGSNDPSERIVTEYYTDNLLENFEEDSISVVAPLTDASKLNAKSLILVEQNTGKVLFESNADEKLAPASITKIMSLLLIVEAIADGKLSLTDTVTCSEHASSMGGSQIWFEPGEQMTVDQLLKAVAVGSANDATVALAEAVAGSEEAFVDMMNERAKQLEMTNTVFHNCSGLDAEGHLTTARDIAIMSRELMRHSLITKYTTIWMDTLRNGETQLVNTNKLVRFYEGATGLKTGTTDDAGCCLSATATRNGLSLIAVIMGSPSSNDRFSSAKALLNHGFATYAYATVPIKLDKSKIPVTSGTKTELNLSIPKEISLLMQKTDKDKVEIKVNLPESVQAPVKEGEVLGRVEALLDGETVATVEIKAKDSVNEMNMANALLRMLKGLTTA